MEGGWVRRSWLFESWRAGTLHSLGQRGQDAVCRAFLRYLHGACIWWIWGRGASEEIVYSTFSPSGTRADMNSLQSFIEHLP